MIKTIEYTKTEQMLLDTIAYMEEIPEYELVELAADIERWGSMYVAIELGRCPSTDRRTYILHTYKDAPKFDYYGVEKVEGVH